MTKEGVPPQSADSSATLASDKGGGPPSQRLPAGQLLLLPSHSPITATFQPVIFRSLDPPPSADEFGFSPAIIEVKFLPSHPPRFGACPTVIVQTLPGQLSGLERVWHPCPISCWRLAERFGERLATLPHFMLETCGEVWRKFGNPAPFHAGDLWRGLEKVWQPCPILCWRPVERFGESLATLPHFVLETCGEV